MAPTQTTCKHPRGLSSHCGPLTLDLILYLDHVALHYRLDQCLWETEINLQEIQNREIYVEPVR